MSDTLGNCGCVDYHMSDCPIRTNSVYDDRDEFDFDSAEYGSLDNWDQPEIDPADCDHGDFSWSEFDATCDICGIKGIVLVSPDFGDPEPVVVSWKP